MRLFATSVACIGPAIGVFFVFGSIAAAAGVAASLAFIIAGIGFLFHVNTSAQYSRAIPSAGSYAAFLGNTFGQRVGASVGMVYAVALLTLYAAAFGILGDWTAVSVQAWFGVAIPWWVFVIVLVAAVAFVCVRGVVISTGVAAAFFLFESTLVLAASILMLVHNHAFITSDPFDPRFLTHGALGLGLAFPLCVFALIGASASLPLAEEAARPRRSLPLALYAAATIAIAIFVVALWATSVAYHDNVSALIKPSFPFISAASPLFGPAWPLLYLAGLTSALAVNVTGINQSSRVLFSIARTGALPRWMADVHPSWHTPWKSALFMASVSAAVTLIIGAWQGIINEFSYVSTLGTAIYVVLLIAANIGLPVFYYQQRRGQARIGLHIVMPILGVIVLAYPLWLTVTPAQLFPYNFFGLVALVLLLLCAGYGWFGLPGRTGRQHHIADEPGGATETSAA
jgi:amino acid transporter